MSFFVDLNEAAPRELYELFSGCMIEEDFLEKLDKDPSQYLTLLLHMKLEGNESLAARLLYHIKLDDLANPEVKKVETVLRNRGLLNRAIDPDMILLDEEKRSLKAHKSILALESPHFMGMNGFKEDQEGRIELKKFSSNAYRLVVNYLYLSDKNREAFVTQVDKALLPEMARLASLWGVVELTRACDEELCNSLDILSIDKNDIEQWLEQSDCLPKFTKLLGFINRVAGEGSLEAVINQLQTLSGAAKLAPQCTPEEVAAFATLITELGKVCRIPPGAFGKKEWEAAFPVTILDVPPPPKNIHEILEQEDPCEPGKKLKETCMLFLRPEEVILHEGGKLSLTFDGVEVLAKKATHPEHRTKYFTVCELRDQMNQMAAAPSDWVLMRKEVIPGSRNKSFEEQKKLLKGHFEVPKLVDAILLNILVFAGEGKCLYGSNPCVYTRCQEKFRDVQTSVGGFGPSELNVFYGNLGSDSYGLSAAWKF